MGDKRRCTCCLVLFTLGISLVRNARAQEMSSVERKAVEEMLQQISKDVSEHYYDPHLHGLDWRSVVAEAKERMDRETDLTRAYGDIAAAVEALNDSHTYFVPPHPSYSFDYGWQYQIVGDRCFITRVRPGSDPESKGVKPGDEILAINGFHPTRENFESMMYTLETLRPQPMLNVTLLDPAGSERSLKIVTRVERPAPILPISRYWKPTLIAEEERERNQPRVEAVGDDLMIVKIPAFFFTQYDVKHFIGKARRHQSLIIDLRENPGGSLDALRDLVAGVFDHEIKIADNVEREGSKPIMAKSMGRDAFSGKLIVLVDSNSASAAETFARVIQIERRGTVIGDRSSGRLEAGRFFMHQLGATYYGALITTAAVIMSDGKTLELTGVTPDESFLPSAADLAAGRDPVMARAAEALGLHLSADDAGKLFPYKWPSETP